MPEAARDDEATDSARAERLAKEILRQQETADSGAPHARKWHDIDVTLARHIRRLQAKAGRSIA